MTQEKRGWSYVGETGPKRWGQLRPCFGLCDEGEAQSPINIPAEAQPIEIPIEIRYEAHALRIENNGHSVQVIPDPGSSVIFEGRPFALKQIHFHAHSEHTIAGQPSAMEAHLVHQDAEGQLLVLGVLVEEGQSHPTLRRIFSLMPSVPGERVERQEIVDPSAILPSARRGWMYTGSLTTPPCSEEVRWVLFSEPIEASREKIAAFRALYPHNCRPTQPLNGRSINGGLIPATDTPRDDGVMS
ncbi:carbonic anhydrase family protein [Myxococcota bacterium]|nr:carbonic anhydrase family protein [Myxococcota bacterium]MBU1431320.1 carbonic anhydrase family protein [Myxococcota bacterium]MBU1896449.1 carbonic anhydrase family protein [Myxococcota bacterium]